MRRHLLWTNREIIRADVPPWLLPASPRPADLAQRPAGDGSSKMKSWLPCATSSPSGWYELLRFRRNMSTDPLPANAAYWRRTPTDVGTVWTDLNAPGTGKFSDADFPAFKGWNCFDDDPSPDNQRCDSIELKRLIRDHQLPESIRLDSRSCPYGYALAILKK